ncbi:MAG: hypothetical protein AAB373_05675 [Patescibacteria group bacterium]
MPDSPYQNPIDIIKDKVSVISVEKRWAVSCYIPVFNIVTCVLTAVRMVSSQYCLFHARQGLVLFGLWFMTLVVALFSPVVSLMLLGVVLLLHGAGMVIAFRMQTIEIPILGKLAMRIPPTYLFTFLTTKKLDNK